MKNIGLILLAVGIGLAAAYGAKNPADIHATNIAQGQVTFFGAEAEEAFAAYCEALLAAEQPLRDGCPDPDADDAAEEEAPEEEVAEETEDAPEAPAPTYDELVAAARADIDALRADGEGLPDDVAALRTAWVDAKARLVEPSAHAATAITPSPGERLSAWFSLAGVPFVLGIVLVIIGAVLARKASHSEAGVHEGDGEGGPVDFGHLLGELADALHALAADAGKTTPSVEDFERVKTRVEELQTGMVERLIGARIAVERRHGLAVYAAIFSPLSAGERLLNRSWAALSDKHWPEAVACLDGAAAAFEEARGEVPTTADA